MKILIVNDDGIHSRGIAALAKSLSEIGDVQVIAPLANRTKRRRTFDYNENSF